jgi:hypothetical protein
MTPENHKKKTLEEISSFLREERFYHWRLSDIQMIEAAIEAAYDAGKSSPDYIMKTTVDNLNLMIERGAFRTKRG